MSDDVTGRVMAARGVLQTARDNLEEAVAALPGGGTDNAMATPALHALLACFVQARRHLDGLELLLARAQVA